MNMLDFSGGLGSQILEELLPVKEFETCEDQSLIGFSEGSLAHASQDKCSVAVTYLSGVMKKKHF